MLDIGVVMASLSFQDEFITILNGITRVVLTLETDTKLRRKGA